MIHIVKNENYILFPFLWAWIMFDDFEIAVSYSLDGGKTCQNFNFFDCNIVSGNGNFYLVIGFFGKEYSTFARIIPNSNSIENLVKNLDSYKEYFLPFFCQKFPHIRHDLIVIKDIQATF